MDWRLKAGLQFFLSLVPNGEQANHFLQKRFGLLKNLSIKGKLSVGLKMVQLLENHGFKIKDSSIVEVGTGWQPCLPAMLSLLGARRIFTFDHVRHVRAELATSTVRELFQEFENICGALGIPQDNLASRYQKINFDGGLEKLFASLDIEYLAPADATRSGLPENSIDLFFTNEVLEHVPEESIRKIMKEAYRTLKKNGIMYHGIGLHDHYVSFDKSISRVNFLKYSGPLWKLIAQNNICYLNRLRNCQYVDIITEEGFEILQVQAKVDRESLSALETMKVAEQFKKYDNSELATVYSAIVARKPAK